MFKRMTFVSIFFAVLLAISSVATAQDAEEAADCAVTRDVSANECPPPGFDSWDAVLEAARGQTVNVAMWGGSDSLNEFVDTIYGSTLEADYGIRLNRIPLADTADAVNQVLSEAEADVTGDDGSIDLIWINGENFATLQQADLLYGPWARNTPNSVLVDWENPAIATDFGIDTDWYETPWASFPFQWMYDTARIPEEELPRNYAELFEWMQENPGLFTYPAPGPGAFQGTRIVKQLFLEMCGGYEAFAEFDQETYDDCAPMVWETLNAWEPYLWREGETYPATATELNQLFANGEVVFSLTQRGTGAASFIAAGEVPPTAQAFFFDENMIGGYSFWAVPFNAPNKAAALVYADMILRPDMQAAQIIPENGAGYALGIDVTKIEDEAMIATINEAFAGIQGAAPPEELSAVVPNVAAEYHTMIEQDWEANVLRGD